MSLELRLYSVCWLHSTQDSSRCLMVVVMVVVVILMQEQMYVQTFVEDCRRSSGRQQVWQCPWWH